MDLFLPHQNNTILLLQEKVFRCPLLRHLLRHFSQDIQTQLDPQWFALPIDISLA